MRFLSFTAIAGLALAVPARAWQPVPSRSPKPAMPATEMAAPGIRQRVKQNRHEVNRLQQEVATQESASELAARRLQQQDREISELRRQLQQLQARGPGGPQ